MPTYKVQREFAEAAGITPASVSILLRRSDCPVKRDSPWTDKDVDQLREWRLTLQENRGPKLPREEDSLASLKNNPRAQIEMQLKLERIKKLKLEREIKLAYYMPRIDVEQGWAHRAEWFAKAFQGLPSAIAGALVGLSAEEIETELRTRIESVMDEYIRRPRPGLDDAAA